MWSDKQISDLVNSQEIEDFINSPSGQVVKSIDDIPLYIFKEDVGCDFYFALPIFASNQEYDSILSFMRKFRPEFRKKLEAKREQSLCYNPEPKHNL